MRTIFFIALLIFIGFKTVAQQQDVLYRYEITKKEETLYGYKNKEGKIIFPAKYGGFGADSTFENIIAVMEKTKKGFDTYYLLRNGKKILKDSVYIDGDFYFDTEQEGMIRFQTKKPYTIGFLNTAGKIVIPNTYNDASAFKNGLAVTLKGAKKSKEDPLDDHWSWIGGRTNVINKKNEVVINNFGYPSELIDWYSLKINQKVDTNIYVNFKTVDNKIYSFIDFEKQFNHWLKPTKNNNLDSFLSTHLFSAIEVEIHGNANFTRKIFRPEEFTKLYVDKWQQKLKEAFGNTDSTIQVEIMSSQDLYNNDNNKALNIFFDRNQHYKSDKFPVFEIAINYYKKRTQPVTEKEFSKFNKAYEFVKQEMLSFVRIENDFKLVEVVERN
jgi:WG containing repeat